MNKLTVKIKFPVLGLHPGQVAIVDDTPKIRRMVDSGYLQLLHEDVKRASRKSATKSEEHPKASGSVRGNGTEAKGPERFVGDPEISTSVRRDQEHRETPWDISSVIPNDIAANKA